MLKPRFNQQRPEVSQKLISDGRATDPERFQSSSQNQGRQHCPANHALSSGVGSTGQCKPLPFFGRCYHCNKSNSVARVSSGAEASEPRGKCLVALSETGANRERAVAWHWLRERMGCVLATGHAQHPSLAPPLRQGQSSGDSAKEWCCSNPAPGLPELDAATTLPASIQGRFGPDTGLHSRPPAPWIQGTRDRLPKKPYPTPGWEVRPPSPS